MIIEFHATEQEVKAIDELVELTGLPRENILRQGLRLYQLVASGHSEIVAINPLPPMMKGCGGE